ncbi:MAG TPA: helix-turn-helix domain-containing protein [Burkholderiaceae bacterium]
MGRLRKKLELDAENPQIIKSVRGAGYIFIPPVSV